MKVLAIALAAALSVLPAALHAQDSIPIRPNDRLRFAAPSAGFQQPVTGTAVEIRDGELHVVVGRSLTDPAGMLVVIPVTTITHLERSQGRGSRVGKGILGLVVGTGAGAIAGRLHRQMQAHTVDASGNRSNVQSYIPEMTIAGAAIGTLVGVLMPGERWRPLGVPATLATQAAASGAGTGVALRIAF